MSAQQYLGRPTEGNVLIRTFRNDHLATHAAVHLATAKQAIVGWRTSGENAHLTIKLEGGSTPSQTVILATCEPGSGVTLRYEFLELENDPGFAKFLTFVSELTR